MTPQDVMMWALAALVVAVVVAALAMLAVGVVRGLRNPAPKKNEHQVFDGRADR